MPNSRAPHELLLLDGWQHRRAPGHWQGWLAQQATDRGWRVEHPTLPHPEAPSLQHWRAAVLSALHRTPGCTVIAHGLSALLWLHLAADGLAGAPPARRVLLVAPPAPAQHPTDRPTDHLTNRPANHRAERDEAINAPLPSSVSAATVRALSTHPPLLVHADDDPWAQPDADALYGRPLQLPSVLIPDGAHLNAAAGFGPWPATLHWLLTGVWPDPAAGAQQALSTYHLPHGRRLGIAVAGEIPAHVHHHVAALLEITGQQPLRRLATIRPRVGESRTRAEDVTDFVRHYGHEYTVVTITEDLLSDDLAEACRAEGCRLVTTATHTSAAAGSTTASSRSALAPAATAASTASSALTPASAS